MYMYMHYTPACAISDLWSSGSVLVSQILHNQGCLFPVEAMLWQLRMRNNDHEHVDRIRRCCTVILKADWQAVAVRLPLFLWLVLGSTEMDKLRQTPSGLYSLQAISDINDWLQAAR